MTMIEQRMIAQKNCVIELIQSIWHSGPGYPISTRGMLTYPKDEVTS